MKNIEDFVRNVNGLSENSESESTRNGKYVVAQIKHGNETMKILRQLFNHFRKRKNKCSETNWTLEELIGESWIAKKAILGGASARYWHEPTEANARELERVLCLVHEYDDSHKVN